MSGARRCAPCEKGAERLKESAQLPLAAPEGDVVEFDELCLCQPPLWLWAGVSRHTRRVLGVALGDRSDATLSRAWAQVPADCRGKPVYTDRWGLTRASCRRGSTTPATKGVA